MDDSLKKVLTYATIALSLAIIVVLGFMLKDVFMTDNVPTNPAEQAYAVAKAQVAKKPKDPDALFKLAKAEADLGRTGDAVDHLKKAIQLQPAAPMLHYTLGRIYLDVGREKDAIKEFQEELRVTENRNELAWYELGVLANKQKKYNEAATYLSNALMRMQGGADAHFELGKAYEGLGRDDLAVQQYQEVIKYIPDHPDAQYAIQQIQLKKVRQGMSTPGKEK